jgi:hypothetical protein
MRRKDKRRWKERGRLSIITDEHKVEGERKAVYSIFSSSSHSSAFSQKDSENYL